MMGLKHASTGSKGPSRMSRPLWSRSTRLDAPPLRAGITAWRAYHADQRGGVLHRDPGRLRNSPR